ncbi:MAG: MerR family transcriptional regulator [Selenomonadaceae bacterium]|nr:MerR family transcriptional regulator [Selenomonadaceae bacterium]
MQKNNNIPFFLNNSKTKAKNQEENFLKTGQVAKILHITRDTIQDWAKKGILIPDHITNGYNYYTEQQITSFLQTAENLFTKSQNCGKSLAIKSKTAENLKNLVQFTNQTAENLSSENSSNINKYNLLYPTVNYSAKTKVSNMLFRPKKQIKVNQLNGIVTLPSKKDFFGVVVRLRIHKPEADYEQFFDDASILTQPLNEFDQAVYDAVVSLYVAGNTIFTTDAICKVLAHNTQTRLTDKKRIDITFSMLKLYAHFITIITDDSINSSDWTSFNDNSSKFKGERKFYTNLKQYYQDRLLNFRIVNSVNVTCHKNINGSKIPFNRTIPCEWELLNIPVLYDYAATKKQIAATHIEYLNTSKDKQNDKLPALNRNTRTDNLANFLAHEIDTMKKTINNKRPYSRFILLKTVYSLDGINDIQQDINSINKKKFRSRQKLDKLLTRLKENGLIRDYIYHKKQQVVYSAEILL